MGKVRIAKRMMRWLEVTPDTSATRLNEIFHHPSFRDATQETQLQIMLAGTIALDLGCFTGGRAAAWFERYRLQRIVGVDIEKTYIDAQFHVARGEDLPAYSEIIEERGEAAAWYRRSRPELETWERGNTINGTTLRQFRKPVKAEGLRTAHVSRNPFGSVGRRAKESRKLRWASELLRPLAHLPLLEEAALHRIAVVLEKVKP